MILIFDAQMQMIDNWESWNLQIVPGMARQLCGYHPRRTYDFPEKKFNQLAGKNSLVYSVNFLTTRSRISKKLSALPGLASKNGHLSDPAAQWFVALAGSPPFGQTPIVC